MSGRTKIPLNEQLNTCNRRLAGHGYKQGKDGKDTDVPMNENSNPDRYFRLLMRQAELEREIFGVERQRRPRRASSNNRSKNSGSSNS